MSEFLGKLSRSRLAAITGAGGLALGAAGTVGVDRLILDHSAMAAGIVECASGRSVEGVWIQTLDGHGWAKRSSNPNQKNVASFSRRLPHAEIYAVHVGCGGDPNHWASSNFSPGVSTGEFTDFICYDTADVSTPRHRLGRCAVVHP